MRLPSRGEMLGVAAGAAVFGVAGCGNQANNNAGVSEVTPAPTTEVQPSTTPVPQAPLMSRLIHCTAIDPDTKWAPTPSNMNETVIAQALGHGVTPAQVAAGSMGAANCDEGIKAAEVTSTRATIKGVGKLCVVIGLGSAPTPNKTYHDVLAVCAAPSQPGSMA